MIKLNEVSILAFLPRFLRKNKSVYSLVIAIDTVLKEVLSKFQSMKRMEKISSGDLTEEEIEFLLWEKHVDYFDKTLTREQKIKLIQNAEKAHLLKGTRYALDEQLNIIFGDLTVQEWFEYKAEPYHFRVLSNTLMADSTLIKINRTIEEFKNTKSLFEGVQIIQKENFNFYFGIAMHDIKFESDRIGLELDTFETFTGIAVHEVKYERDTIS